MLRHLLSIVVTASLAMMIPVSARAGDAVCGTTTQGPERYQHVIWVLMENHKYSSVIGNTNAPYITSLAAECASASAYQDAGAYPSLPNYLALTSGTTPVTTNCPSQRCPIYADNLFRQVRAAGGSAISFAESLPGPCFRKNLRPYAPRHVPATYYADPADRAACRTDVVPLDQLPVMLADEATTPMFSFVTPNLDDDMHDGTIAMGDAWLAQWLPQILNSPAYLSGNTAVFVLWDENTPCPSLFIAPSIPPGSVSADPTIGHYATLRTTEELLGITEYLGAAASASSYRSTFNF
jgi:hypothetical protein